MTFSFSVSRFSSLDKTYPSYPQVDLDQLNKVEQQVELLVELARHGSSVNTTIQGYNSRDQLLMELARLELDYCNLCCKVLLEK